MKSLVSVVTVIVAALSVVASSATVSADASRIVTQQDLVGPAGSTFGSSVVVLENGNYVVVDSGFDSGAKLDVGAAHLYNGLTDIVIDTVTGTKSGDSIGSGGVVEVGASNYVILSSSWDNGGVGDVGAVTFGNGTTGVAGTTVTTTNSLYGTAAGDEVGSFGVVALANGNYAVASPLWDNGATGDVGAVTFGNGTTGITGPVTTTNSLHGTTTEDQVGRLSGPISGVTALTNGNYVVASPLWDNGATGDVGAVTFGNGTTGITGPVTTTNSLHGTTAGDAAGSSRVTALTNGNYVVASPLWDNGATGDVGAVTFGGGTAGITGPVTTANSLHGPTHNDLVGDAGVTALTNGSYTVASPWWRNGGADNAGAVTFAGGAAGITGPVTTTNSLHGTTQNDSVGYAGVTALTNGNYTVISPWWDNGGAVNAGAVTFGDGTTGITGAVTTANSLHGPTKNDRVGGSGATALANGNYAVASPLWDNGATGDVGAVTFGNGTTGITGPVTTTNSLHGTTAGDEVGRSRVTALTNGNYVVASPLWDNGATGDVGAVTFGGGTAGIAGPVTTANSLHGTTAGDAAGSSGVTALSNGNYAVTSSGWDNAATGSVGAVTFGVAAGGVMGPISSSNSAIGTPPGSVRQPGDRLTSNDALPIPTTQNRVLLLQLDFTVAPPSAPSGVSGIAGDGEVLVFWDAPASNGGSPITGYTVTASPGGKTCMTSGALSCTVDGLTNGIAYTFTVRATNAAGTGPGSAPSSPVTPDADAVPYRSFVPLTPARVLDTRGGAKVGSAAGTGQALTLNIAGKGGLPASGIGAVALNVTVTQGELPNIGNGFVTVYPCGTRPEASNLNFTAGQTIPNSVIAPVSATGTVCFYVYGTAHLVADVSGYFPTGPGFRSLTPARVLDTRGGAKVGNAAGTGTPLTLNIAGEGGVPTAGVGAVALNVTVTQGELPNIGKGFVTVYPCGTRPEASNLNFSAGQTIPNSVIAPVSATGTVCFYVYGTAHLIADVSGYFPTGPGFESLTPDRVLDTRGGAKVGNAAGTGQALTLDIAGKGGLPDSGIGAVALNVTVTQGELPNIGNGFVTVYPCGTRPEASNLNFTAGQTIPNSVIAPVSATGTVCFYVYGTTHLLADVSGYFPS